MDEILSYLRNPMNKWAFGVVMFFVIIVANLVIGKLRSRADDNPGEVNKKVYSNEPMSNSETIGDISVRLGDDVRDVWARGYSNDQINGVLTGKYTLEELYRMKPKGDGYS